MKCIQCKSPFQITDEDRAFYQKVEAPEPTLCPDCRQQRRLAFRNERHLQSRNCDLCQSKIISIYDKNTVGPVYCQKCWWGDQWNAADFGQEFDFDRPFFEQFKELYQKVPKVNLYNIQAENAQYCNFCMGNKDCYLVFGSDKNRDCYYSQWIYECRNLVDCAYCYNSENLYKCLDCVNCYECFYCQDCESSQNCWLSFDLKGCKNCFGCIGLRQKEYHLFNKPVSQTKFEGFIKKLKDISAHESAYNELKNNTPKKYIHSVQSENCQGDFIVNSKEVFNSFDVRNGHNILNSDHIFDQAKDCMDCSYSGEIELCYDSYEVHGFNLKWCHRTWPSSDSYYLDNCDFCNDCFGCVGLRHQKYCILNKQYSKEEYNELKFKIINRMRSTGEWGEFFPIKLSPFAYNETVAHQHYPLNKEEVQKRGWKWKDIKDEMPTVKKIIPANRLPDNIKDIPDDVLNWAIKCKKTNRPYKINQGELKFYRKYQLPIPKLHPDERYKALTRKRNPQKLFDRNCNQCDKKIQTTYSSERPEKVYCKHCYLKSVY